MALRRAASGSSPLDANSVRAVPEALWANRRVRAARSAGYDGIPERIGRLLSAAISS